MLKLHSETSPKEVKQLENIRRTVLNQSIQQDSPFVNFSMNSAVWFGILHFSRKDVHHYLEIRYPRQYPDTLLGRHLPSPRQTPNRSFPPRWRLQRMVRILLECIVVSQFYVKYYRSIYQTSKLRRYY